MSASSSIEIAQKEYLYDMLAQLARIARLSNERRTALVLDALVAGPEAGELPVTGRRELRLVAATSQLAPNAAMERTNKEPVAKEV